MMMTPSNVSSELSSRETKALSPHKDVPLAELALYCQTCKKRLVVWVHEVRVSSGRFVQNRALKPPLSHYLCSDSHASGYFKNKAPEAAEMRSSKRQKPKLPRVNPTCGGKQSAPSCAGYLRWIRAWLGEAPQCKRNPNPRFPAHMWLLSL